MTRDELLHSREYWIAKIQLDLFSQLDKYMSENDISRTQLAEKLGVTKGYVSQILNGDFDHKISKLVDLALAMGKVPQINYMDVQEYIDAENRSENNSPYRFSKSFRADYSANLQIA
ncbi:helix-turn-helix domain-containing protein [Spirosoma pollinicola]|uniref:XRE family transcriptional regulator n=1 Tax=Spirosoma pollinicola TaxID=2057025 RepID=A0A2K8YUS1_9BACT|nr:helix-turn-helix transcriptional regulator [Spirosoma pollinicola]AUD01363.1 XRE family transcriptional regulator [Spirosoma pollinicola]